MFPKQLITRGASSSTGEGVPVPEDMAHDNSSMVLNGVDEYIVCCNSEVGTSLQGETVAHQLLFHFWIKRTAESNDNSDDQTIWNNGAADPNKIFSLFVEDGGGTAELKIKVGTGSAVAELDTGLSITNNQWHHILLRVRHVGGGNKQFIVILDGDYDNRYQNNGQTSDFDDSPAFQYIGADNNTGTPRFFFKGKVSQFVISGPGNGATVSSYWANTTYNNGALVDAGYIYGYDSDNLQSWLRFGDSRAHGHRDGDDDKLIIDFANIDETDLMENNGFNPGTNIANWSIDPGSNWVATDTFILSAASGTSPSVISYNTTGDFELLAGWLYRLQIISNTSPGDPSDNSTVTFAGNTIKAATGWSIVDGTFNNYYIASNTNDLTFTSFADNDSSAASLILYARIWKPTQIAYAVGLDMTRGSGIVIDSP